MNRRYFLRELCRKQLKADRLVTAFCFEASQRNFENRIVIECQFRDIGYRKPCSSCRLSPSSCAWPALEKWHGAPTMLRSCYCHRTSDLVRRTVLRIGPTSRSSWPLPPFSRCFSIFLFHSWQRAVCSWFFSELRARLLHGFGKACSACGTKLLWKVKILAIEHSFDRSPPNLGPRK